MDRLEALGNTLSQITLYDIKSVYNQAKNVVLNVSEMEAKVQEATNDEPWGASSTLMQEIAQGTFNFQQFNEIMPAIYSRFMEKEARQWRQIYKALQLLEYLIKNGSERVVDDARSHISTVKMLRNFYYVDDKGKDQGINVRNRSKEIVELLSDVEKIRGERRKAKTNKSKYTGVGNEGWGPASTGTRYGGFGSDSFNSGGGGGGGGGSYSGGGYDVDEDNSYSGNGSRSGGDGGYSGGSYSEGGRSGRFQEYDAGDDETPRRSSLSSSDARPSIPQQKGKSALSQSTTAPTKAPQKPPVQEVDLLGFADDDAFGSGSAISPPISAPGLPPPQPTKPVASLDDDEFDDFQAAPPSATNPGFTVPAPQPIKPVIPLQPAQQFQPIQPVQPVRQPNFFGSGMNVMSSGPGTPSPSYGAPNYNINTSIMSPASPPLQQGGILSQGLASGPAKSTTTPAKPTANFDDLWNISLGATSTANKSNTNTVPAKSMKDLEKEKSAAGIWGATNQNQTRQPTMGGGLWGPSNANTSNTSTAKPSGGVDDLLF